MKDRMTTMRGPRALSVMIAIMFATSAVAMIFTADADDGAFTDKALGEGGDVLNKINFGGAGYDVFSDIIKVPGGFVAVGYSAASSFGTGDWVGPDGGAIEGYGGTDATIVKFTDNWSIAWKTHFGGAGEDVFFGVTIVEKAPATGTNAVNNGYLLVAVGYSGKGSFFIPEGTGEGYWVENEIEGYGDDDAIIVAFDWETGAVEYALNFGGAGDDGFTGVTVSKEGNICAVGYSYANSFGSGIWQANQMNEGYGGIDAVMAVYTDGALLYARHFGGAGNDIFYGVAAYGEGVDEFFYAVGYSGSTSFGNGSWADENWGVASGYGGKDAIIVGYNNGTVYGAANFGGAADDEFRGVGVGAYGDVFAVGFSQAGSFGNGSWADENWGVASGYGGDDAIIVAYGEEGELIGAANFGGAAIDAFNGVAVSPEGSIVAVGFSQANSFGNGSWADVTGNGVDDAIAVGYSEGEFVGAMNFGGAGGDGFTGAVLLPNGNVLVVGSSDVGSFGTGDWAGVEGKGGIDAIVVMFDTGMETSGTGGGNDFPVTYVAIAAVGIVALLGIAYVFVLKKP